jgi:hypothetical protein
MSVDHYLDTHTSCFWKERIQAYVPVVSNHPRGTNVLAQLPGTHERYAQASLLIRAHYNAMGDDLDGRIAS